jgi:diadenosine tetraphosphate (Ap4A) HIT family hydrolase
MNAEECELCAPRDVVAENTLAYARHDNVHLIPRYTGDVADPRDGIRCVLPRRRAG